MNPQQALQVIEQMRQTFQSDGKSHDVILQAMQVITKLVTDVTIAKENQTNAVTVKQ